MFKTKALLCLGLCMCLCTLFVPNAFAASQYPLWQPPENQTVQTTFEGSCGENATWFLDEDGTLTVSGTGEMTDASSIERHEWSVKKVVIKEGITSICQSAFSGFRNLTKVELPDSLKKIGGGAFSTTPIPSIEIPDGVETIEGHAFDTKTLTSIFIPASVTSLDPDFLGGAINHIDNFEIHPDNPAYVAIDRMLLTKDRSTLLKCCGKMQYGLCRIPIGVKTIKEYAFLICNTIVDLTIPEGVETIERFAFEYCSALKTVRLPKSIKEMGLCVFRVCESLENVYYAGSEEDWAKIKFDNAWAHLTGDYTFHYNNGDRKSQVLLTIGEKNAIVNGTLKENDVAPKIVNGRTMLPIRFLAENLGASVTWNPQTNSVFLYDLSQDKGITMAVGADNMLINGITGNLRVFVDTPGFIEDGRSYFPVRAISEALYCNVEWDEATQTVRIQKY